ncbi:DUF1778 domain-containing protein [Proteus mirabilis]|uniref:type II toxin-antitoxin system TacA family antitoxin n=1 Tax=Proteus mirabilis TaxID=584 RepID=UPI0022818774|nr:DUF1778 domain-containing protein [Proteus mirabilis]MCY9778817.1 DUF1778 domain-containing protein [Proteus mirabilis]MCY9780594.1 DUF1778 domain-containing protein [Proteus mirabilis]MCY9791231.1 DUF1778 domain-containing protein [Proteus mirabilis]
MAQALVENSERVSIRITTEDKSRLVRAASLENTNLTEFVLRNIVPVARQFIENNERLKLSEKDTLRVMELLDNPPKPNAKLFAVAFALPDNA